MSILKQLIKEIEDHTGEEFDLKNKRHFFHLNEKIKRLNSDKLRKLSLIEAVIKSENNEDSLYNSSVQYAKNRYRD